MQHAEKISVTVMPRLEAIRARVHRSIDDPRPSLGEDEVDAQLEQLPEEARVNEAR